MAKRPDDPLGRAIPDADPAVGSSLPSQTRHDRLEALLDQCTTARTDAEALNEKLLSYLLAMAVEEARNALGRTRDPIR